MELDFSSKIIKIVKAHKSGIQYQDLQNIAEIDQNQLNQVIEQLVSQKFIQSIQVGKNQFLKYTIPQHVMHLERMQEKFKNFDKFKIYEIIYNVQEIGIEKKQIQNMQNLHPQVVTKILKELEKEQYIKTVKSKKKKLYLSIDIQFQEEQGGVWLKDGQIDQNLVENAFRELKANFQRSYTMSPMEIQKILRNQLNLDITEKDTEQIINMMICDEVIEKCQTYGTLEQKYKLTQWEKVQSNFIIQPPLTKVPCGLCELRNECRPGNYISPENCIYFENFPSW